MDNQFVTRPWPSKRQMGLLVGSASLALLFVGQVIRVSKRDGNPQSGFDAQSEQSELNQPQSAVFSPSVSIEDEEGVAAKCGVTITAVFIGMSGEVPVFADLVAARNGVRVASWRTLIGGSFEIPIGDNLWCRLTVEEIKFLPSAAGPPSKPPNVILSIKSTATHSVNQNNAPTNNAHVNQ